MAALRGIFFTVALMQMASSVFATFGCNSGISTTQYSSAPSFEIVNSAPAISSSQYLSSTPSFVASAPAASSFVSSSPSVISSSAPSFSGIEFISSGPAISSFGSGPAISYAGPSVGALGPQFNTQLSHEFIVTSGSPRYETPAGVSISSTNELAGQLSVSGSAPFFGATSFEGEVFSDGQASVGYSAGPSSLSGGGCQQGLASAGLAGSGFGASVTGVPTSSIISVPNAATIVGVSNSAPVVGIPSFTSSSYGHVF